MTADTETRPLTPDARARRGCKGRPVVLAGGAEWRLPDAAQARAFDALRDRMYESMSLQGRVATVDVMLCGWMLLTANYDVAEAEAAGLLKGADREDLTRAVLDCLMGEEDPVRSYSAWVRSSLIGAGLRPEDVPDADLPFVLFQLVNTGRAVPLEQFAHVEIRKSRVAKLLAD